MNLPPVGAGAGQRRAEAARLEHGRVGPPDRVLVVQDAPLHRHEGVFLEHVAVADHRVGEDLAGPRGGAREAQSLAEDGVEQRARRRGAQDGVVDDAPVAVAGHGGGGFGAEAGDEGRVGQDVREEPEDGDGAVGDGADDEAELGAGEAVGAVAVLAVHVEAGAHHFRGLLVVAAGEVLSQEVSHVLAGRVGFAVGDAGEGRQEDAEQAVVEVPVVWDEGGMVERGALSVERADG